MAWQTLMKKIEPLGGVEFLLIAVLGDGNAFDQFHYEVRTAGVGRSGIQHLGDVGMVHQRQGLALGLEPSDDLLGVHPQFDDLEGDPPSHRLLLFGRPDRAEAALAKFFQEFVAPDSCPCAFRNVLRHGSPHHPRFAKLASHRSGHPTILHALQKIIVPSRRQTSGTPRAFRRATR